jgi:hypothetical protein
MASGPNIYYATCSKAGNGRLDAALAMCERLRMARETATPIEAPLPPDPSPDTQIATTKNRSSIQKEPNQWA